MSLYLWPWFHLALFLYFPSIIFPSFFFSDCKIFRTGTTFHCMCVQHAVQRTVISAFRQHCQTYADNTRKLKSMFVKVILCFLYDGVIISSLTAVEE